jgi:hypothetical protein
LCERRGRKGHRQQGESKEKFAHDSAWPLQNNNAEPNNAEPDRISAASEGAAVQVSDCRKRTFYERSASVT